jgi:Rps23 Pro-64 3,4-dihydroxylase Tpa1-like proline 4-hydroxylase
MTTQTPETINKFETESGFTVLGEQIFDILASLEDPFSEKAINEAAKTAKVSPQEIKDFLNEENRERISEYQKEIIDEIAETFRKKGIQPKKWQYERVIARIDEMKEEDEKRREEYAKEREFIEDIKKRLEVATTAGDTKAEKAYMKVLKLHKVKI